MTGVRRLNHAVLFVSDVQRAKTFYTEVLGFTPVQEEARMNAVFLRASGSTNHHDLGLFGLGEGALPKQQGQVGLYHLAWQVDTIDELADLAATLANAGALTGASDHGASKSLYAADPDGNEFEVMWAVPQADWGEFAEKATVAPLRLEADIARWGGVGTLHELGVPAPAR